MMHKDIADSTPFWMPIALVIAMILVYLLAAYGIYTLAKIFYILFVM